MKIKLHKLFIGGLFICGWAATAQTNQILTVSSGFNADVIADGTGAASSSSTIGVDNANYAFMTTDYRSTPNSSTYSNAIPASGLVTASANSAIRFQFAPFNENNSLRLQETNDTGTLTFSNPIMAVRVYVMATGGSGQVTTTSVVNFDDGTTQTATGTVVPDWYYSTSLPVVISGMGRVSRNDNGIQNDVSNPRIYMYTINITTANQSKRVSSIQFTKTSTAEGVLNVFGVSAAAVPCVTPAAPTSEAQSYCGVTTVSQLTAAGTVTNGTFRWYTALTGGTALAPTAEVASGTYYVAQVDGVCESTRTAADVIVNITPQPEGPTEQYVCPNSTLSDLIGTGVEGGTVTWTYNDQEIPLGVPIDSGLYVVTQTIGTCTSIPKEVTVTVGVPRAPEAEAEQTLCSGSLVGDIIAQTVSGSTVNWSFIGFITQPVELTDNLNSGLYSVRQSLNGCTSNPTYVRITLVDAPTEPGGDALQSFYVGETVSTLDIDVEYNATVSWFILNDAGVYEPIPEDTFLEHEHTYYVGQSFIDGCLSPLHAITATNAMGRDNNLLKSTKVYPNPVTDVVTVNSSTVISKITIINMLGQKVMSQLANASDVTLNVAHLPNGSYILQAYTQHGVASVKVIKQ
ncbi:T9SS type A sorting domain-containing protein [Flavobacterium sp. Sd200]|uniref:T9SS type A sorting domain-containing protein n=1 Tax=Flavobacterium sp. Sd200 TaxID=2692211 RepID=UPI0013696780|nr:T9SS type A sorting domain-containing protein [Flavobacterium sp. Sd200]MXN92624.1 T9SS type A sorting domain-containing protein [Flavobacterium sp. Sd200]